MQTIDKKYEQSSKTTRAQDKENIQHMEDEDKKVLDETKKANDQIYDLCCNKTISPNYWKELAEKRQHAIVETAKENEELHEIIDTLKSELVKLKNMARRAELLEEMLTEVLDETSSDGAEADD